MLRVEAVFNEAALRVEFVQDGVRVGSLMVREHRDSAQLRHLDEELAQVRPLVHEYFTAKFFVLSAINNTD